MLVMGKFFRLMPLLLVMGLSSPLKAAQTAYFSLGVAYLTDADVRTKTVSVVNAFGAASGNFVDDGMVRLISLSSPISVVYLTTGGACAIPQVIRRETHEIKFSIVEGSAKKGRSTVLESGVEVELEGCNVGNVTPFGNNGELPTATEHIAMTNRPSMKDVKIGSSWAGLHQGYWEKVIGTPFTAADVVTVLSDREALFEKTNLRVRSEMGIDGWWMLDLPLGKRQYTRLTLDRTTGTEMWLYGDVVDGKFQWVHTWWVSKHQPRAGFGDVASASRAWGHYFNPAPFVRNMYSDYSEDILYPSGYRLTGWTWSFEGMNVVHRSTTPVQARRRIWEPVRTVGATHWVLDEYIWRDIQSGYEWSVVPRVVVKYTDTGPAVKPSRAAGKPARGSASVGSKSENSSALEVNRFPAVPLKEVYGVVR
jgi:hypothetical protein